MSNAKRKLTLLSIVTLVMLVAVQPLVVLADYTSQPYKKIHFGHNKYYLFNNVWGQGEMKGSQYIYHNTDRNFGWGWHLPSNTSTVKSYPSIVNGWHWTNGYTNGSEMPAPLWKNIYTGVSYNFSNYTRGTYNAAYDIWLHDTKYAKWYSKPSEEIMIWVNNTKAGPIGQYVETVWIGGHRWKVHKGWLNAGNGRGWMVYSFVRTSNTNRIDLNIRDFTNYLSYSKHWLSNSRFISSVEFGTEIFGGSGAINFSRWYVDVQ